MFKPQASELRPQRSCGPAIVKVRAGTDSGFFVQMSISLTPVMGHTFRILAKLSLCGFAKK